MTWGYLTRNKHRRLEIIYLYKQSITYSVPMCVNGGSLDKKPESVMGLMGPEGGTA